MRWSWVRSKTAPQCSSSTTRSGASLACSSAMRQSFRYLPPNIVSWKCVLQSSSASTFPSEAATPPSAMTVCALPSSDLLMITVFAPAARAAIAARRPAPPAPMTRTSQSTVSISFLNDPGVVENAAGCEPDVEVGERDRGQADPRPLHVLQVEDVDAAPGLVARARRRRAGEAVEAAADEVAQRVAAEREGGQADHVPEQDERAEPDAEAAVEEERAPRVVPEEPEHDDRQVQEVPVHVLEDQRERGLAAVPLAPRAGDGAPGRREEERAVVGLAVVVTGESKPERHPRDEQGGRERDVDPEERLDVRRVERRQVVGAPARVAVVVVDEDRVERVDAERGQHDDGEERRDPPPVPPRGGAEPPWSRGAGGLRGHRRRR